MKKSLLEKNDGANLVKWVVICFRVVKKPVVVCGCSKSYCPYCRKVKELLKSLGANAKVIEIDEESMESKP
jgi:thiol-disulfide isomerase/thioredoxin